MMSRKEALAFAKEGLKIPQPEKLLQNDRPQLLDAILNGMAENIPFQNVTLMAMPKHRRKRPSLSEIKAAVTSRQGGICYAMNVFLFYLLRALGYDVALCPATVTSTATHPNNHVLVLVRSLKRIGDTFLAECGVGYATCKAVPLDFEKESPIYTHSFLQFKYVKHDGKIMRVHGNGDFRPSKPLPFCLYVDGWRRFYEFQLRPVNDLKDLDAYFDFVYTKEEPTTFHSCIRASCYPNGRAVIVSDARAVREDAEGQLETTPIPDDVTLAQELFKEFPQLSHDVILDAITNLRSAKSQ